MSLASATLNRESIIGNIKESITCSIAALRDLGLSGEQIATIVFACSTAAGERVGVHSGSSSSAASVAGDDVAAGAAPTEKKRGRPKKEKDPSAPASGRPGNGEALKAAAARGRDWYEKEYKPTWESKKDEWRALYARIPVKKDAKRERGPFPEDKPVSLQIAQSFYKLLHAPTEEELKAKKAATAAKRAETKKPKATATAASKADESSTVSTEESQEEEEISMYPLEIDGQNYVMDDSGNCWHAEDGAKGDWAGVYDAATGMLDDTAAEPAM